MRHHRGSGLFGLVALATAAASLATPGAAAATTSADNANSPAYERRVASVPDSLVLVAHLRGHGSEKQATATARAHGATLERSFPKLDAVTYRVPATSAAGAAAALRSDDNVAKVEQPAYRKFTYSPNDPAYAQQSAYLNAVQAPAAWDVTKGDAAVKIAIVDSGVDVFHPDLAGKVAGSYNAVTGTANVSDEIGHGTFVAGIAAAASDNGAGVAGAGFDSSVLAVKVADATGDASVPAIAQGVMWAADHGAKIVNLSLGSAESSDLERDAIAYAQSKGVLVVAAAGNSGGEGNPISYPAAYPGVISVGATDPGEGTRASFSGFGTWVTLAAPGVGTYSTAPTAGSEFFVAGYDVGDGTSFSSPIVAGELALLAALSPTATAAELKAAVVNSAHGFPNLGLGAGQVDFAAAITHLPPTTVPTFTAPGAGPLAGTVTLTASSSAPAVRFSVDGKALGAPVPTVAGIASAPWPTWGLAGSHTVTAADCTATAECSTAPASLAVDVANAPSVPAPPASADALTGAVTLTATSDAPRVQFRVDGAALGAPVTTTGGSASTSWSTFGYSNGEHAVSVLNCGLTAACADEASIPVTVANAAPALTSPAASANLGGALTLTATAPGGGVRFVVDGATKGFDATAPYAAALLAGLPDGAHAASAVSCNASGTRCAGPTSAAVAFTTKSLHPAITSVSPKLFSPNGDGRADSAKVSLKLPDAETVSWSVLDSAGKTVIGPRSLGALKAGTHSVTFSGKTKAGAKLPDGAYNVVLSSTGNGLRGTAVRGVQIDTVAPKLSSVTGADTRFYPVTDGYKDTFAPAVTLSAAAKLTLAVTNSKGSVVRTVAADHPAGRLTVKWNGKTDAGKLAPTGAYGYTFTAQDGAGNRTVTSRRTVNLSLKKLVAKTTDVTVHGDSAMSYGSSKSCASAATSSSAYSGGLKLRNNCAVSEFQFAAAFWDLTLPAAHAYTSLALKVDGATTRSPSAVVGSFYDYSTGEDDIVDGFVTTSTSKAWRTVGTVPGAGHVYDRIASVGMFVPNDSGGTPPFDFDVANVRIRVAYTVLQ